MIILAMDLSLTSPGFTVGEVKAGKIKVLHISHVTTNPKEGMGKRLAAIFHHIEDLYRKHSIDVAVKERGFHKGIATTAKLRKVDGVAALAVFLCSGQDDIPEIGPTTVKKAVTGDGKADKDEVLESVHKFISNKITFGKSKAKYDEADSLAVLIAYAKEKKLLK